VAAVAAAFAALAIVPTAASAAPTTVIVKYRDGVTAAQRLSADNLGGVLSRIAPLRALSNTSVVSVLGNPVAAAARLERSPAVEYAEPNYTYHATATPNDPQYPQLYGLNNTGQTGGTPDADIDAPEGWDAFGLGAFPATGGAKVGIVDTGITVNHEDLVGKTSDCGGVNSFGISLGLFQIGGDPTIVTGKCADDNGHGTHVSGTVAAIANNGKGVAGVAFNSPLAMCKALDSGGSGSLAAIANCITWVADRGAKVISMSLGGSSGSQALLDALRYAIGKGALPVAAAGNGGNSTPSYPAAYPEVVSVAATDSRDQKASFSTFNADVEVAAPGVNILSTWNNGAYNTISGTSMATPHVAGVVALIAGRNPTGGPSAWRTKLDASVDDLGAPGRDPNFGFGRVNLVKAAS
jgi:thermitase